MGAPVVHFEITSEGGEKLNEFYRSVFDWNIDASNPMKYGVVLTEAGKGIDGGISAPDGGGSSYVTFYVEVPSIDATLAEIEKLGGKTLMPRTVIPEMVTFAQFADPSGNMVGLVEPMP